jgi:hypothetical protein
MIKEMRGFVGLKIMNESQCNTNNTCHGKEKGIDV